MESLMMRNQRKQRFLIITVPAQPQHSPCLPHYCPCPSALLPLPVHITAPAHLQAITCWLCIRPGIFHLYTRSESVSFDMFDSDGDADNTFEPGVMRKLAAAATATTTATTNSVLMQLKPSAPIPATHAQGQEALTSPLL